VEFASERIEALQSRIARREGFRIFDHELELYGHCSACAPKGEGGARGKQRKTGHG
jgi:Fe2+ or Zn2+ uptake regulation protein